MSEPSDFAFPTFASDADRKAWELDYVFFGTAVVDENGKHIPLDKVFLDQRQPESDK